MPHLSQERQSLRTFLSVVCLVLVLAVMGGFLGMILRSRTLIQDEIINRARTDFRTLVNIRSWNAAHGGVYVEKRPGMASNPYLANPDITDQEGRVYTRKNPALMTRELSERLHPSDGYSFHIRSLRPINPVNAPDPMEAAALHAFEQGSPEQVWTEAQQGRTYTRYMAPLKVEASCLACHAFQGYRVGDVRGGISVTIDTQEVRARLRRNTFLLLGLALVTATLLVTLVHVYFWRLVRRLMEARRQLEAMATTDALTGLLNRHHLLLRMEQECARQARHSGALACLMLDVDHFKAVNDQYGHLAGDETLRGATAILRRALRPYDLLGRYGGEEFIALLPETDAPTALQIAERLRSLLAEATFPVVGTVTASFGLSFARPGDTVDSLIHRADLALYRAKANGRNQVCCED